MRVTALVISAALAGPVAAQEQEAGNEASRNAEETFQQLIAQCDDTDALVLRARIRLLLGRTTPEAAEEAEALMNQGLSECGEGDMETAMATLNQALDVADAGTDEVFSTEAETAQAEPAAADAEPTGADPVESETGEERPWWKFW